MVTSTPVSLDAIAAEAWGCKGRLCVIVERPPCTPARIEVPDRYMLEELLAGSLGDCWAFYVRSGLVEADEAIMVLVAPCREGLEALLDRVVTDKLVRLECV